jgi:predicted RNase H-like nuclease (RuvC/YqgF family)
MTKKKKNNNNKTHAIVKCSNLSQLDEKHTHASNFPIEDKYIHTSVVLHHEQNGKSVIDDMTMTIDHNTINLKKHRELEQENVNLKNQIKQYTTLREENENYKKTIDELEKENKQLRLELDDLKKKYNEINVKYDELKEENKIIKETWINFYQNIF